MLYDSASRDGAPQLRGAPHDPKIDNDLLILKGSLKPCQVFIYPYSWGDHSEKSAYNVQ